MLTVALMATICASAFGQPSRTRVGISRTKFELDENGRSTPGFNSRGNFANPTADIDVSKVDKGRLINLLREAVQETSDLQRSLQRDAQRYRELLSSLSEVRKLRTGASYIVEDLQDGRRLETLMPVVRELSSDWHLLSHQLGQSPRTSSQTRDIVNRVDGLTRRMEQMFRLDPQLDRRALVTELAKLHGTLDNLLEELEYDPKGQGRNGNLTYDTRKLGQQIHLIEGMVLDNYSYERIVTEYNRFSQLWTVLVRDLRQVDNRYIEREIRHILASDSRIHDLLWLEKTANREHLRQLASALIRDVDEFFNRTPLRLVVDLKNVDSILEQAGDFYGTVQHFKDTVKATNNPEEILESYTYVEQYGHEFVRAFRPLRSEAGKVVLKEIEDGIAALQTELHLSGNVASLDSQRLLVPAARLENLADHLKSDVRIWLDRDRQAWRQTALDDTDRFVQRARRIHRVIQGRPTMKQYDQEERALAAAWTEVHKWLQRCLTEDKAHFRFLQEDINAALYDLESPLRR